MSASTATDAPRYLTLAEIARIHDTFLHLTGAPSAALRDPGLLESALARPRAAAHYEGADLVRQAALLAVGISQAQAFVDGNKRTGFAAGDIFLRLNGLTFAGDPVEFGKQFEAVAERSDSLDAATERFEAWLRERVGAP